MPFTKEQIDLWRSLPSETQAIEFKEAKNNYDTRKLCEYCVALANEGGGQFVLGVADTSPRPVVGSNAFPSAIKTAENLFEWVGFRVDVEEVNHPDGRVVVFNIPPRPRGTAYNYKGTYLMRSRSQLVPMSEDRLRVIFAEGRPDWLEEPSRAGLVAQDVIELLDTQTFFELRNMPYPSTQALVLDRLAQERLIDFDPLRGFTIKRLAALALAKRLTEFPDIARKAARVVVYNGTSKLETKLDTPGTRGYAVGFQSLVQFIMAQLPQNEAIEEAIRREHKMVPEIVVRELVANALVHQDFKIPGGSLMIEVYSNRIEISNPGDPVVPVKRLIDGYQSRNENLADLMRRLGVCEEKGSGIDKVVKAVELYQLPAPDFTTTHERTVVVVYGLRKFDSMSREDRIRAC